MTWLADHWLDVLGWGGSALLVYSLLQTSVLRLRVLNAIACLILIVFNWALEVWPMVGMNTVLVVINAYYVVKLLRERHDQSAFEVLAVSPTDEYLRHTLRVHGADILRFNPSFSHDPAMTDDAFLVQKGDETVGVVLLHEAGDTAHVLLDYVTPRYRDFSPGEFVWQHSGLLAGRGLSRIVTSPGMVGAYYDRVGFRRVGDSWELGNHGMITVFIRRVLPMLGLACALAVLVGLQDAPAAGSDTWLHLRFGHEFMSGWSVGHPGHLGVFDTGTWYPTQWGSQIAMASVDSALGLGGVIWLAGFFVLLLPIVLYLIGRSYAAPLPAVLGACLATAAAAPGLSARPQVLSYLLIAVVTATWLVIARDGKPRYWLVLLAWIWVPLHGMWLVGVTIGIAAVIGMALARPREWRTLAPVAAIPVLSVVVAVLTPLGLNVFRGVTGVGDRNEQLTEWQPPDITSPSSMFLALMIAVVLVTAMRSGQVDWPTIMILGLAMAWGFYSARTVMVGAVMIVPLFAQALQRLVPDVGRPGRRELATVAAIFLVSAGALAVVAGQRADTPVVAGWVDDRLDAMPAGTKVLNDWALGHYALWAHPQVDVVMHGYVDVFTTQELERNIDIVRLEPRWDSEVADLDVDYAFVDPDSSLGYALENQLGWTEVEGDDDYVLLTPGPVQVTD